MARPRAPPVPRSLESYSPKRTLLQIIGIQAAYYASFFALTVFTTVVAGLHFTLDYIFDWKTIRADNTLGWTWGFIWVLNALVIVIAITLLVARSKLVLDFALTAHFLHFLFVSLYSHSIPRKLEWWICLAVSSAFTVTLANWTCQKRELQPLKFTNLDTGRGGYEMVPMGVKRDDEETGRREGGPS